MSLKSGMEMRIKGVPKANPVRFTINVGHSDQNIALHFDLRFNYLGECRTIVMNAFENGCWGKRQEEHNFPFEAGREFENCEEEYCKMTYKQITVAKDVWAEFPRLTYLMTISLTDTNFFITLPDGNIIKFPNRLGDKHYDHITIVGDVMVDLICAK